MLGLVLISHSKALAQSLVALAQQVCDPELPIAFSGGAGENHDAFGTDAIDIARAIQETDHPNGIVVLMDLGSAVLSAKMALELLPEDLQSRVHLCPAPLVEGAIAAAVQAAITDDPQVVCQEAQNALTAKQEQLGHPQPPTEIRDTQTITQPQRILTLVNPHGLHARPAAKFVQTAARFDAEVYVRNLTTGKGPVSARSLNSLATLGALKDHQVGLNAQGTESIQALDALSALIQAGFGEIEESQETSTRPPVEENGGKIIPIAEGIAIGPVYTYQPPEPLVSSRQAQNPSQEWERLQQALTQTETAIAKRRDSLAARFGESQAAIFDAHILILKDPDLLQRVHKAIFEQHKNAAAAWQTAITEIAATYQSLEDTYLQQRATDVQDVGRQVLLLLTEGHTQALTLPHPVILLAEDLTPTETAQLDLKNILGIATVLGGPTSHSAILARSMGIPAIAGTSTSLLSLPAGTEVALDGFSGQFWVEPSPEVCADLEQQRTKWLQKRTILLERSHQPAQTGDGHNVEVVANAGSPEDAHAAYQQGAEGIGLLRTEFLFLTRQTPPSEAEQVVTLHTIGNIMHDLPVIVRTLDVGGDKPLPYIQQPEEANPFLGTRAIRLGFRQENLFRTQLRAILRAAARVNLRIMFPMVATLDEIQRARALLESVHADLEDKGISHCWPIETGIMVEIPAAALSARVLAPHVDFFSIGTNDLTQYTLAAERGNPNLNYLSDGLHPAVLALIHQVVEAAHAHDKWVGVCGELAGDTTAVPILIGLGVDELSVNPALVPQVKERIRQISYKTTKQLAEEALNAADGREVRLLVNQNLRPS